MLSRVAVAILDEVAPFELGVLCEVFGTDRSEEGLPVHDFALVGVRPGPLPARVGFTTGSPPPT